MKTEKLTRNRLAEYKKLARKYNYTKQRMIEFGQIECSYPDQKMIARLIWLEEIVWDALVEGIIPLSKDLAKLGSFNKPRRFRNWKTGREITYQLHLSA